MQKSGISRMKAGYTAIHSRTMAAFVGIALGIRHIRRRNVAHDRQVMQSTYGAAVLAGTFALLPQRYLGSLLWHHTLGVV